MLVQGITMKLVDNKLIIARILYGGLIHRQGLLQVGDRIVEVNQEPVDSMNPSDLQALLVRLFTCCTHREYRICIGYTMR